MSQRSDFHRVRTKGQAHAGRYIVLSVFRHDPPELPGGVPFRFGVILTRKIGKAVVRNRIRRHLRAVLSELGPRIIPGHDVVLIGRFRAPDSDLHSLRKDWKILARKAGILQDHAPSELERPVL